MELFYNPERMSEREIKETFIAHQWLVDEIISILKRQPDGPGVQHVVIVAPRGMGKTTMLLMLRFTVLGDAIGKQWQPVLFPEESYDVYELADLWLAVLNHIAAETKDLALQDEISTLTTESANLEEIALARLKNWRTENDKRLFLLIDNFDMILDQIGDERENARLRDVLMNDGVLMLVGGATTFFKEARAYDQPLYNLFKIYNLNSLDSNQIRDLLRRRAELDGRKDFDELLRANESRIRVLEYFTGGNPRLVLMLYRIITHSQISEVRRALEKLLDEVTPYYKAKIESLPSQQRKILDQIARSTSRTREGLTPTEIAKETRLAINLVSSQLKRLSDAGYVHPANIRGRSSYYTLSEPLYAIWHQMRFGRDARRRMNWLVAFLRGWYDSKDLGRECERLLQVFRSYMSAGRENEARDALEHGRYLMEAIEDAHTKVTAFESVVLSYLELRDLETLRSEVLADIDINLLTEETQRLLSNAGMVSGERVTLKIDPGANKNSEQAEIAAIMKLAHLALADGRISEAKDRFNQVLKLEVSNEEATIFLAGLASYEGNFDESDELFSKLEQLDPDSVALRCAKALFGHRFEESLHNVNELLRQAPTYTIAWHVKALILKDAFRAEEAIKAIENIPESDRDIKDWYLLAEILADLGEGDQAVRAANEAIRIAPDSLDAIRNKSKIMEKLGRYEEASVLMDRVLSLAPNSAIDWHRRGGLLLDQESPEKALESLNHAIELDPNSYSAHFMKALTLDELGLTQEGYRCVDKLLELEPKSADAYFLRAIFLGLRNPEESKASLKQAMNLKNSPYCELIGALATKPLLVGLWARLGEVEEVKIAWNDLLQSADNYSTKDHWLSQASEAARSVASTGRWSLAKDLIVSSHLEEELFPLARALDYLLTKNEDLVEKLSPEIKQIVIEIVHTLRPPQPEDGRRQNKPRRKSKSKRIRK